jgi:hypothetical protein
MFWSSLGGFDFLIFSQSRKHLDSKKGAINLNLKQGKKV